MICFVLTACYANTFAWPCLALSYIFCQIQFWDKAISELFSLMRSFLWWLGCHIDIIVIMKYDILFHLQLSLNWFGSKLLMVISTIHNFSPINKIQCCPVDTVFLWLVLILSHFVAFAFHKPDNSTKVCTFLEASVGRNSSTPCHVQQRKEKKKEYKLI